MDKPSDKIYVEHILEAIGFIETFVTGLTVERINEPGSFITNSDATITQC